MQMKRWRCAEHGVQETMLEGGPLPRCPMGACGRPMLTDYPGPRIGNPNLTPPRRDPRVQTPPRGEERPI